MSKLESYTNKHDSSPMKILFGHSLIYAFGTLIRKGIGFLMIPIYTRYLLPEDYGVLELLITTFEITGIFIGFGIITSISRHYYEFNDEKDRYSVISTAIILQLVILCGASVILLVFSDNLAYLVFGNDGYNFHFKLMILSFLLSRLVEPPLIYLRIQEKSIKYICLILLKFVIALGLNIYTIIILNLGIIGILYSGIISSGLLWIYLFISTLREVGLNFSQSKAISMIKYGAPMALSFLGSFIITFSDRYFLRVYSSLAEIGIYSVGNKFASSIFILNSAFWMIWEVKRFELISLRDTEDVFKRVFNYYSFIIITAGVLLSIFIKPIIQIVTGPLYYDANSVVPILVLAYIFLIWIDFANLGILISKKTIYLALSNLSASAVCLGANYALIPSFGSIGAAWAKFIAYSTLLIITFVFSQRLYKINYGWANPLKLLGLGVGISFFAYNFNINTLGSSAVLGCFLALIYIIFTFVIRYFNKKEITSIIDFANGLALNLNNLFNKTFLKKNL
jgi:O-antigen/teichoic acid export membrane protein